MSRLSKLGRSLKKRIIPALAGFATGGLGGAVAAVVGSGGASGGRAAPPPMAGPMSMSALPALPAIIAAGRSLGRGFGGVARSLPGAGAVAIGGRAVIAGGRALVRKYPRSARALAELGLFAAGGIVYELATGQPVGVVRRHRMNPLNHRALRRAISRVKSARKICRTVEKLAGPRRAARVFPSKKCR